MFEPKPVSERHAAIGVFAAIGLAGAAAFELLVTGGFEPIVPHGEAATTATETLQVEMVDARWAGPAYPSTAHVAPTAMMFDETMIEDAAFEELAGDPAGRVSTASMPRDYEDVARDIEALYAETAAYVDATYEDAPAMDPEPPGPVTTIETDAAKKDEFNASGTASPW